MDLLTGWISPDGKFWACASDDSLRHGEIADLILDEVYNVQEPLPQDTLLELGWLRLDYEQIHCGSWVKTEQHRPTSRQVETLIKMWEQNQWIGASSSTDRYLDLCVIATIQSFLSAWGVV